MEAPHADRVWGLFLAKLLDGLRGKTTERKKTAIPIGAAAYLLTEADAKVDNLFGSQFEVQADLDSRFGFARETYETPGLPYAMSTEARAKHRR